MGGRVDREALIAIADSYLDALTSRDPSRVPLAPDVTRTDHGRVVADNAERIRAYAATTPSRDDVIAVAGRYLNALVSHVGSDVPLAPEALRIENGHNRGDG